MKNLLITGANRGVGLALAQSFAKRAQTTVLAACRNPDAAVELRRLAENDDYCLEIVKLDVGDQNSIASCVKKVADRVDSLYALINNAGIFGGTVTAPLAETSHFGCLEMEAMLKIFRVNTVAPVILAQSFIDLLERSEAPRIINVSSDAGSISLRENGGNYSYSVSKTALNMMSRCLSAELKSKGIIVASVHPGFLKTDMGGPSAPLSLEDTIPHFVKIIDRLTMANSGTFLNWDGSAIPW